jgi:hypothetical protein
MTDEQLIGDVLEAERRRRTALIQDDHGQVEQLFAEDLVYVHTSGLIHDKTQYLAYARDVVRYLDVQRAQLQVRVYGDTAVMTGLQTNTLQKRGDEQVVVGEGFVTQVWRCEAGQWRICSFHGSRLAN